MEGTGDIFVIALGGNAIARRGDDGTVAAQYRRAEEATAVIVEMALAGNRIALTHGNGPVVGDIVLRGELASDVITPTPLYISGADSEGGIGLVLQQVLGNAFRQAGSMLVPATVVTQVLVDANDPAFHHPTKPIGPYFSRESLSALRSERNWDVVEEPGRGWRRVVPSPRPLEIIEMPAIHALLAAGVIPIAAGGGGVPVVAAADGSLSGVDAVVDKDWSGALLASGIGATHYVILMEADALYRDFGTPSAQRIKHLTPGQALALAPTLPEGSVRPKVEASAWFAERGGTAILCSSEGLSDALTGSAGTTIASR